MAYNNGFPMGYQQYYPTLQGQQQSYPQNQQNYPQNNGMIWVQGEAGAKSYLVAPNTTVQLWDSEAPIIYLKSADTSGMPSMKILDYKIREQTQTPSVVNVEKTYVTHDELKAFKDSILNEIKGEIGA